MNHDGVPGKGFVLGSLDGSELVASVRRDMQSTAVNAIAVNVTT